MTANFMIMDVMRAFYWFDEGLQSALKARGWQSISRSQSIMLANIALDIKRPADLARNLGISRQAVSKMLQEMTEDNLLSIQADPNDKRAQIVNFSDESIKLRTDALDILGELEVQLGKRIGLGSLKAFRNALAKDWGAPPQIAIP